MTILDKIQISIRHRAEGAGSSVVGVGPRRGTGERTVQVVFTPEIEGR